jgi:hypothetical protein
MNPLPLLHVLRIAYALPWLGGSGACVGSPIPNNPNLVGSSLCMQNVCVLPPPGSCTCLSNTTRVTIM